MNYNYCILYAYKKNQIYFYSDLKRILEAVPLLFCDLSFIIFRDLFIDNQKIKIRFRYLKNICI